MSSVQRPEGDIVEPRGDRLWDAWLIDRSVLAREELIDRYTGLVRILAAKTYKRRYCQELEYADYMQFGMIGLLEAIDRFNPGLGNKFETFAGHRIQGAILNGVETLSEKQQQIVVRQRMRAERLKSLVGGAEILGGGTSAEAIQRLADVSVGLAVGLMLDNAGLFLDGEPASGDTPYEQVELAQLRRRMADLVEELPDQQFKVIRWHYFQNMQFDEIARSLQLTPGRISQIHHAALRKLRELNAQTGRFQTDT